MLWHIGNTTVRTPYRLQHALAALVGSPLNGNLSGREQEQAFAQFIHDEEIAEIARIERGEDASDVGRKWRVALSQLGFITPQLSKNLNANSMDEELVPLVEGFDGLTGRPFEITPNGFRLATSETIMGQQECFLRAIANYQIPSPLETRFKCERFSPLKLVLEVFHELQNRNADHLISFNEFALFVQTATPQAGIGNIVDRLLDYRARRVQAAGNVRAFDKPIYEEIAANVALKPGTLKDYVDLNLRYLKATGLFQNAGRGITTLANRAQLITLLRQTLDIQEADNDYLVSLWRGAELPTDDLATARIVVNDLAAQLTARDIPTTPPPDGADLPDIQQARYVFEEQLFELDEIEYANAQAQQTDEIAGWMSALMAKNKATLDDGTVLSVPKGEAPAYLEWVVWRAFLAINSLVIPPWEARNFKIDQDFLPVHCAPGGRPDMVFEFEDSILVVEVTLTSSSRQEAAEGEPVRRHVAKFAEEADKQVFGLFIAIQIDSNTAHTFSAGAWYLQDDRKISLNIVPLMLEDFQSFFVAGRNTLDAMPEKLRNLLIECRAAANQDAPQWKASIRDIVARSA